MPAGIIGAERGPAGFLQKPKHQRDGHGRSSEGNDDRGDDHGLGDRVPTETSRCGPPGYGAEYQKHAASQQIECQYLAQRLGIGDEPVQSEAHQHCAT